jgi:CheY-like chemotaxis protein
MNDDLIHALEEISFSVDALDEARRNVNDVTINFKVREFVDAARAIIGWHREQLRNSVADDVAGLLDGIRSLEIPTHSGDLGRTAGLSQLRGAQGQLVMAILGSLEIARTQGYRPRDTPLPIRDHVSTRDTGVEVLGSLLKRILDLELSMDELDALKDGHKEFVQQADLISFVSGSVRSEAKLARMLLRVSDAEIPWGALMRTLEAMTDRINNFWATISAWRARLSAEVVKSSERVRISMRRVLRGARTAIKWMNRTHIRNAQASLLQQGTPPPEKGAESLSEQIAMYLPLMRRYSRALLGSQSAVDSYVGAVLDAIIRRRELLSESYDVRLGLFKVLHDFLEQFGLSPPPDDLASSKVRALHSLPLITREAFLLMAVEGFEESEVARILGVDIQTVRDEITKLGLALEPEIATRVLILDPDEESFSKISSVATAIGHEVLPFVDTPAEALALAEAREPGIIISEVQLRHGESGLNVVNRVLRVLKNPVPTIFLTAYPERFLTGPRPATTFLLSKPPFKPTTLSARVSYALLFDRGSTPYAS